MFLTIKYYQMIIKLPAMVLMGLLGICTLTAQQLNKKQLFDSLSYYDKHGERQKAVNIAQRHLSFFQSDSLKAELHFQIGFNFRKSNDYAGAIKHYGKALDLQNEDERKSEISKNLALVYYYCREYEQAIKEYERALGFTDINRHKVLYNMILAYKKIPDYNNAMLKVNEAIKIAEEDDRPYLPRLYSQLGLIYRDINVYDRSRALHQAALDQDRDGPYAGKAHHRLGNLDLLEGDTSKALVRFQKALELKRTDADRFTTWMDLGKVFLNQGKMDLARMNIQLAFDQLTVLPLRDRNMKVLFYAQNLGIIELNESVKIYDQYQEALEAGREEMYHQIGIQAIRESQNKDIIQQRMSEILSIGIVTIVLLIILIIFYLKKRVARKIIEEAITKIKKDL
jgi:tetratricopeptide (TPR) repeat protein